MNKAYWILAVIVLAIIGGGTAMYLHKKDTANPAATEPAATSPTAETSDNSTKAAVTAGAEVTDTTLDDLSNDIDDINNDTSSSNQDDEAPTL